MSEEKNDEFIGLKAQVEKEIKFAEVDKVTPEIEGAREASKTVHKEDGSRSKLLEVRLNLLEISHRDVEAIEQRRYKLIANKDLSDEKRFELFKDFIFSKLIKTDEVSGINAAR